MERYDRYWIGILIGLLLPALFIIAYVWRYNLWYVLQTLQFEPMGIMSKLLLASAFPDMGMIFVFYLTDTWRLSKGVLIGMFPYLLASLFISL